MGERGATTGAGRPFVLLVEDNPGDVDLLQMAFEETGIDADVRVAVDGAEGIACLGALDATPGAPLPALVLLDLNLPRIEGVEVLRFIRGRERLRGLPVVVMTSSPLPRDQRRCGDLGVDAYVIKPTSFTGVLETAACIGAMVRGEPRLGPPGGAAPVIPGGGNGRELP